jgi:spermidine synthase
MVHPALLAHPSPENILVIGGGDGGILREVLRYKSVQSVDFAELDEEVVSFSREHLPQIGGKAFSDQRVHFRFTDGRAFVESRSGSYDVVIMDMTDPTGPSKMLYTREFFLAVKKSFKNEKGIFVMHAESPAARPLAFGSIIATLRTVFTNVRPLYTFIQMYATLWSIALSSDAGDIDFLDSHALDEKIERAGLQDLKMITGQTLSAMQGEYPYVREILEKKVPIITDEKPDFPDNFDQV